MVCRNLKRWPGVIVLFLALGSLAWFYSGSDLASAGVELPQCAHWAVVRAAEMVGVPVSAQEVYRLLPPCRDGHSVTQVASALSSLGLSAEIRKSTFKELIQLPAPVVLHLRNPDHFVVVLGFESPERVVITDEEGDVRVVGSGPLQERASGFGVVVNRSEAGTQGRETPDRPFLQFEHLFSDRGGILPSQKECRFEFAFTNRGNAPLVIKRIHTKCSCIETEYPVTAIPAGGKEKIVVTYRVDPEKPRFHEEAVVESNDPQHPVLLLKASGRLNLDVRVSPSAVNFGLCRAGDVQTKLVFVRFRSKACSVTARVVGAPNISARVLTGTAEFDARGIWEGAGERPNSEKEWPLVCIELTLKSDVTDNFAVWGEPRLVLSTPLEGFQEIEIPLAARVVSAH